MMKRFEKIYTQGVAAVTEIWVDQATGVHYLFHQSGNAGGLTPLLDREGRPVITAPGTAPAPLSEEK